MVMMPEGGMKKFSSVGKVEAEKRHHTRIAGIHHQPIKGSFRMCKAEQIVGRLSEGERRSLRTLRAKSAHGQISANHEEKLIELGLAELNGGNPDLTHTGRQVLAMIGGW